MSKRWMIYGANGYTGKLVARLAVQRGLHPVLAGRHEQRVGAVAREFGLDFRIFALEDPGSLHAGLEGIDAVLHTAGPFSSTSAPMVQSCIDSRVHYLDVTGEIAVFEDVFSRDDDARKAGISLLPGVGFDVVPTDCLAALVARELPSATRLEIAVVGLGALSQGTWKSSIEGMARGGFVRSNGRIVPVPAAWKRRRIPFPHKPLDAVTVPWGDVSTAYRSTGIPDIWVYMALPPAAARLLPVVDKLRPLLAAESVQRGLRKIVERTVQGPDDDMRSRGSSYAWVEATDAMGRRVTGTLTGPEAYTLTADAAIRAVRAVLEGATRPGAWTPSQAFGPEFVQKLDRVTVHAIEKA